MGREFEALDVRDFDPKGMTFVEATELANSLSQLHGIYFTAVPDDRHEGSWLASSVYSVQAQH